MVTHESIAQLPGVYGDDTKAKEAQDYDNPMTLKEFLTAQFNPIQLTIFGFLQPMTKDYNNEIVCALLQIWLDSSRFDRIGMDVNEGCEKII